MNICPQCGGHLERQRCGAVACTGCGHHDVPEELPLALAYCQQCGWHQTPPLYRQPKPQTEQDNDVSRSGAERPVAG